MIISIMQRSARLWIMVTTRARKIGKPGGGGGTREGRKGTLNWGNRKLRNRRRNDGLCPVQVKVAKSRQRLRVILRSPELPCEIGRRVGDRAALPQRHRATGRPARAVCCPQAVTTLKLWSSQSERTPECLPRLRCRSNLGGLRSSTERWRGCEQIVQLYRQRSLRPGRPH
jgi:hypothetical protein